MSNSITSRCIGWVQRFTPLLADAARPCQHLVGDRWQVNETYMKVAGQWRYVYRAVDQMGQVIDVFVSPRLRHWPALVERNATVALGHVRTTNARLQAAAPAQALRGRRGRRHQHSAYDQRTSTTAANLELALQSAPSAPLCHPAVTMPGRAGRPGRASSTRS
jgi:DDE domain